MLEKQLVAKRNIKLQSWINFLAWIVFLIPVITLFYKYTGLSIAQIILLSNVSTLAIWIFELPTSVFADITWMRKSLVYSVISNVVTTFFILFFPSFWWFIVAAIFTGLYWSFRSWTWQAFLEENLAVLWEQNQFGKQIGRLMALESVAWVATPLIAWLLLRRVWDSGYTILAWLDFLFAIILVIITLQLKEVWPIRQKIEGVKKLFIKSYQTAKSAIIHVFKNKDMKVILLYRTFANHVSFLFVLSLPLLVDYGMEDWFGWVLTALWGLATAVASNFAYKIWEKKWYWFTRVFSTIAQAVLMIVAWFVFKSWVVFAVVILVFKLFDGLRSPAWNHILVAKTQWKAIATTRSIVFSVFALYTTFGKQILSLISIKYAFIILGIIILFVNVILSKKIIAMDSK